MASRPLAGKKIRMGNVVGFPASGQISMLLMVGVRGFEPPAPASRRVRSPRDGLIFNAFLPPSKASRRGYTANIHNLPVHMIHRSLCYARDPIAFRK
jgi:hypothetical protein